MITADEQDKIWRQEWLEKFEKARRLAEELYGTPIAESRPRVVFRDGDEVIKVPTQESGVFACEQELSEQGEKYAKTRLDKTLSDQTGLPIVRMEWVEHTGWSKEPDWTWSIDCGQGGAYEGRSIGCL